MLGEEEKPVKEYADEVPKAQRRLRTGPVGRRDVGREENQAWYAPFCINCICCRTYATC